MVTMYSAVAIAFGDRHVEGPWFRSVQHSRRVSGRIIVLLVELGALLAWAVVRFFSS